jgi:L-ribulokinase
MNCDKLVIGIDYGTDSVRALLVRASDGKVLGDSTCPYPRWKQGLYCDAAQRSFRQHPLDYLEGLEAVVKDVITGFDASLVKGIGIDTTGSTPCAVDRQGTPLALLPEFSADPDAMFLLWKDHSSIDAATQINDTAEAWRETDYRKYNGGTYSCEWFWSKILNVLKNNAAVGDAAFSWVEHCDWISGELTGQTDPLTMARSRCAAGHKAMWHESWGGLPPEKFLRAVDPLLAGLRDRLYSATQTAEKPVGRLSAKWAEKLGLSIDVIVAGGAVDGHVGAVGAGIGKNELVKVFGTSSCDFFTVPSTGGKCLRGICGQVDGSIVPGMIGLEAGQSAFGDIFAWCHNLIFAAKNISFEEMERAAAKIAPGANGVFAIDWFNGRRSPDDNPHLRGAILGLELGSSPAILYRALVEGACCGARAIVERFLEEGLVVDSLLAVGGIARKSPLVMQICADLLNMPVKVAKSDQVCALGGAMFAAVAGQLHPCIEDAMQRMNSGFDRIYQPLPERVAIYDNIYKRYQRYAKMLEKESM